MNVSAYACRGLVVAVLLALPAGASSGQARPDAAAGSPSDIQVWTNQIGRTLQAQFVRLSGDQVVFRKNDGSLLTLPLTALCAEDQRRIREDAGGSAAPAFAQAAWRDARALLERYDRLPLEQKTREERAQIVEAARALFDSRIHVAGATNPAAAADIARLRASLR